MEEEDLAPRLRAEKIPELIPVMEALGFDLVEDIRDMYQLKEDDSDFQESMKEIFEEVSVSAQRTLIFYVWPLLFFNYIFL